MPSPLPVQLFRFRDFLECQRTHLNCDALLWLKGNSGLWKFSRELWDPSDPEKHQNSSGAPLQRTQGDRGKARRKIRNSREEKGNVEGLSLPASPRQQPGTFAETDGAGDPRAHRWHRPKPGRWRARPARTGGGRTASRRRPGKPSWSAVSQL